MEPSRSGTTLPDALNLSRWFNEEVQPHDADLKAYLRVAFPCVRDVDDIVQESYIRACKARSTGSILTARGFLFRVARNLAIDFLRRSHRRPIEHTGDVSEFSALPDQCVKEESDRELERFAMLDAALASLSSRQRQVVILCKLQSRPHSEVAVLLGLSEKTVSEHLYRAMQQLGILLQRNGTDRYQP